MDILRRVSLAAVILAGVQRGGMPTALASDVDRGANPVAIALVTVGGGALAAAGLVAALGYLPARNALDAACPGTVCLSSGPTRRLYDQVQTDAVVTDLLLINGAVYATAGVVWLLADRHRAVDTPHVAGWASTSAIGLTVEGSF